MGVDIGRARELVGYAYPPASRFGEVLYPEYGKRVPEEVVEQLSRKRSRPDCFVPRARSWRVSSTVRSRTMSRTLSVRGASRSSRRSESTRCRAGCRPVDRLPGDHRRAD